MLEFPQRTKSFLKNGWHIQICGVNAPRQLSSIGEGLYRKLGNVRRRRRYSYEGEERSRELDKPRGSFSNDRIDQQTWLYV